MPNYGNPVFHDPDRKEYWDNLYDGIFSKYGVTYSSGDNKVYKVWMNFRNEFGTGAVCGGISKTGSNIRTSILLFLLCHLDIDLQALV